MEFHTACSDGIDRLYHWERFDDAWLRRLLNDRTIYCSDPATFNDPWDCKPYFNTKLLEDPLEHKRHVEWAVYLCRKYNHTMSENDIARMEAQLHADRQLLAANIHKISRDMWGAIAARYRVYCLGPDVDNLLMWSHYADKHRGICIEFSTHNDIMCSPLRVDYFREFPVVRAYSTDGAENLRPLLTKADVWEDEREYRLIAQESGNATNHETLKTNNNLLKLPESALLSVIVGCLGPFDEVQSLVAEVDPDITVKRAKRLPNRFELKID